MGRTRESNYDMLRMISAIAVIAIHVSSTWIEVISKENNFGESYQKEMLAACLYNVLSRFAVPCFIMLSGAFILADERNADYKRFYRKTFVHVGVPTLLFSALYFLPSFLTAVLAVWIKGRDISRLLPPIERLIKGAPYYHMWYLYMMAGVYLLVPVILLFKKQVGEKIFGRAAWIFLVCASLGYWTSRNELHWDIGASFRYVSYLMVGYELRKTAFANKNNKKGILLIAAGTAVEMMVAFLRYVQALRGIENTDLKYELVTPLCPLIVIASVCIFAGFSHLDLKREKDFGKLTALTFPIYLFHAGVWGLFSRAVYRTGAGWNYEAAIPVSILLVLIISAVLSKLYIILWNRIEGKWKISDKLCQIIRLQ